jgi:hypothetical protein
MSCCGPRDRFISNSREFTERARDLAPEVVNVARIWTDVIDLVLTSEDHFRAAERRRELDIESDVVEAELKRARPINDSAIQILRTDVTLAVEALREKLISFGPTDISEPSQRFDLMAREQMADSGFNVYQVREGRQILERTLEAGRTSANAVCDLLTQEADRLIELRQQREQHNDPVAAVFAGIFALCAIAIMSYAAAPGGPSPTDPGILILFGIALVCAAICTIAALSALPWAAA